MKRISTLAPLAIVLLFLAGCVTQRYMDPRVQFIDTTLPRDIIVTSVNTRINDGGLLEMQLSARNDSYYDKNLEYRIEWLDNNGFEIKTITTKWNRVFVNRHSDFRVIQVGPSEAAADFRIQIRYAR
ncbi:MAG: YcfL family protein [Opitutales bacterium]|nr:YcfL family protein [Opitutales bacterium]